MALIDEVVIRAFGGSGGNGCISFRREKYIPRGGPNGGNGGRGGNVSLLATRDKTSLLDFKYQPKYEGERGEHGMGKDMDGRGGEDLRIAVPVGTMVYDAQTNELLADLVEHDTEFLIAQGGKGGRGNMTFKSSTNRAPRTATPGEPGEIRELRLELRLIADVGLIGLPNAGKSSFLCVVSRATPKVADYPFTTLEPHLGVVDWKQQSFVVADLPGLIEGASGGAGLGHQFLKHVARNRCLLHLVDITAEPDATQANIEVIRAELGAHDAALLEREQCLVFTKIDLLTTEELTQKQLALKSRGLEGFYICSHTRAGLDELLDTLAVKAQSWKKADPVIAPEADDVSAPPSSVAV